MNATPEQLARFAALVGITPDTHGHLFKHRLHCCECGSVSRLSYGSTWVCTNETCPAFDYGFFGAKGYKQAQRLVADFPALDTPAGDDVFLAPFMRWCKRKDLLPDIWECLTDIDDPEPFGAEISGIGVWMYGSTMTLALISACQSAGVAEIIEIFGKGDAQ